MLRFDFELEEALCLIDAFRGIVYSEPVREKKPIYRHLKAVLNRRDTEHAWVIDNDVLLGKIDAMSDDEAAELMRRIYTFWTTARVSNLTGRLREVGMIPYLSQEEYTERIQAFIAEGERDEAMRLHVESRNALMDTDPEAFFKDGRDAVRKHQADAEG